MDSVRRDKMEFSISNLLSELEEEIARLEMLIASAESSKANVSQEVS